MSARRERCPQGKCSWLKGRGHVRERCVLCGNIFSCPHACGHIDCRDTRGEPLPDWIHRHESESL